jgi:hypothetical protein
LLPRRDCFKKHAVRRVTLILTGLAIWLPAAVFAQIDPFKRDLIQIGYNQPLEGQAPVAAYAFYYHNQPGFLATNVTWRLALAPVYLDTEFGFARALGANTDFAVGAAGGGFADSYSEIDGGRYLKTESFDGHGAEVSASIYHLFNPGQLIPLNLVLRGAVHYSAYEKTGTTDANFQLPDNQTLLDTRIGLRWGGIEPTLFPELAMELSAWYASVFRSNPGSYGYKGDRDVEFSPRRIWTAAALSYTLPESRQNFFARLVAGTSLNSDRLSAYRLGGFLPLAAEYPLSLPGYYYNEFSARQFVVLNASYLLPIAPDQRWNLNLNAATAVIDYQPGTGQPGCSVSGVGGGLLYRAPSDRFRCIVAYGYGIDARRGGQRGANSISFLLQIDLDKTRNGSFETAQPDRWQGWNWLLGR